MIAVCASFLLAATAAPSPPLRSGEAARWVEMRPRDGASKAFEEGYKRHLAWHRANGDPWTWHGWFVATGDRAGTWVDGTFGHSWSELDRPIKPAEDMADNAANVFPHAALTLNVHLVRIPERCRGEEQDALRARLLTALHVRAVPGQETIFLTALDRLPERPIQVYRQVGGPSPAFRLLFPHADWQAFATLEPALSDLIERAGRAVAHAHIETLRYRADLSYEPTAEGSLKTNGPVSAR